MAKIHDLMDDTNYKIMAEEISIAFTEQACQENVEYQWTIRKEDGQISSKDANTSFSFDPDENSMLREFIEALYSEELSYITEGSREEKDLLEKVGEYMSLVSEELTKNYKEDLQEVIRRVILGNKSDPETMPLDTIQVLSIDLADYSSISESEKYLLKVFKEYGTEIETDEIVKYMHQREEETGESVDTIFCIEKQAGNPLFENVTSVQRTQRFLNEINVYFFVDYSIARGEIS